MEILVLELLVVGVLVVTDCLRAPFLLRETNESLDDDLDLGLVSVFELFDLFFDFLFGKTAPTMICAAIIVSFATSV